MGLFERIFRKQSRSSSASALLNEMAGSFTSYSGDAYANDTFRAAVDAIARNCGKLKGSHVIKYEDHSKMAGDCKLNRLLQIRPNAYMTAYDFLYKFITHYFLYNNSFALLERDQRGNVLAIYPITANNVEMLSDELGNLYCHFYFTSGKQAVLPYSDLIHLRRDFNNNDLLGDDNSALVPALELAHTQNEGIINGIKAGANIRGILSFDQILAPGKLKEEKEAFITDYLQISNDGGVVATDKKMTYTPIESKPVLLNADQAAAIENKIFSYLGVTKEIVNSSYTEDQFAAFYESVVEPIAVALGMEFTSKIFNDREQAFGNQIIFESGRMQFTSNGTKVNLIKEIMPLGLLTINQALEILNLPGVPDGDKRLQSLNYVDAEHATEYQMQNAGSGKKDPDTKAGGANQ
jgi:HK97 family phage portal protein